MAKLNGQVGPTNFYPNMSPCTKISLQTLLRPELGQRQCKLSPRVLDVPDFLIVLGHLYTHTHICVNNIKTILRSIKALSIVFGLAESV